MFELRMEEMGGGEGGVNGSVGGGGGGRGWS